MVKIKVGGDLDKQYASFATGFFHNHHYFFSSELHCIFLLKK